MNSHRKTVVGLSILALVAALIGWLMAVTSHGTDVVYAVKQGTKC